MRNFLNKLIVLCLKSVARLPFSVIYILADIFYLFSYHVLKYCKKVITENLQCSFPRKSDTEVGKLVQAYYRHFSDITLESIKMYHMPPIVMKDIKKPGYNI